MQSDGIMVHMKAHVSRHAHRRHAALALGVAAAAYLSSLLVLQREPDASVVEPLFLLAVLGLVFPLLALLLTQRRNTATVPTEPVAAMTQSPARGLPGVLVYLAVFSVAVLGWGFSWVNSAFPDEPLQSVVQLALKLATMVVLPAWLFLGPRLSSRATLSGPRLALVFVVMSIAYLALQAVFGRGLTTLGELSPSAATLAWAIPLCWLWQTIEAGLCEEVLFRRILQEKIFAASGSQVAAVAWASLLFGLAHAPGLWLRAGHLMEGVAQATPAWAIAYSIVMIAPAGIAFGILWARTRSLWLIVPLHGMVDLIPQLAPFIRAWTE